MRSDRYLKKRNRNRNRTGGIAIGQNQAIALNSPARVKAMMANIAKIDWSNPYKEFIK